MIAKNISGMLGERSAAEHLEKNGYEIIRRNYKNRISEIDIIAKDGDTLCFIEVKTRKNKNFGTGAEFVNREKIHKMILGARSYIQAHNVSCDVRFDVVEVYGEVMQSGFRVSEINIIKNAFVAD